VTAERGAWLLPAQAAARGPEFERAVALALFESGLARPISGPAAVRTDGPGQWDGVVFFRGAPALLECKAYLSFRRNWPKLERRLDEAAAHGLPRVLLVALSGSGLSARRAGAVELVEIPFSDFAPPPPPLTVALSTGDRLEVTEGGFRHPFGGFVSVRTLPAAARAGVAALVEAAFLKALKRACFFASRGARVELESVEPYGATGGEIGLLWRVEDLLGGFCSPSLSALSDALRALASGREPHVGRRVAGNLRRVLERAGVRPGEGVEAVRRAVLSFEPFVLWAEARKGADVRGALEKLRERYSAYRPYAVCPYNPNKARACERYLKAAML